MSLSGSAQVQNELNLVKQQPQENKDTESGKHFHENDLMHPHSDPGSGDGSHYPQSLRALPRDKCGIGAQIISSQTLLGSSYRLALFCSVSCSSKVPVDSG